MRRLLLAVPVALGLATAAWLMFRRQAAPETGPHMAELRQAHERLHERLHDLVRRDKLLAEADADSGQLAVVLRTSLLRSLFREVARRYLDRVELDLVREIPIHETGEIKLKTFLGTVKAGDWTVDLTIHHIRGLFRARTPQADFGSGGNRVRLGVGIVLEQARGDTSLHFKWDSAGIANIVCKDFEVRQELTGVVLPDEYPVSGGFLLTPGTETVLARPEFPDRPFRLRVDLTEDSWAKVRRALEEQDTLMRCGIGIDPDSILPKLKDLGQRGFDLRLPRTLFRPVELPANLRQSVAVEDRQVDLTVKPSALRVTTDAVWMSAAIQSRVSTAGRAPSPAAPHWDSHQANR